MEYYFERTGFLFKFHQKKRQDKLLKTMWNLRHSWGFYRKCTKSIKRWQGYAQAVKINRFRKPILLNRVNNISINSKFPPNYFQDEVFIKVVFTNNFEKNSLTASPFIAHFWFKWQTIHNFCCREIQIFWNSAVGFLIKFTCTSKYIRWS